MQRNSEVKVRIRGNIHSFMSFTYTSELNDRQSHCVVCCV